MNHNNSPKAQVLYTPCPPEEFAGRFNERKKLLEIISQAPQQGQMVMVSGARGSGKSSFLNWAEYEIQNKPGGLESPAIKKAFLETPGMIFATYKEILTELKGHQKFGWFRQALEKPKVKKSIEVFLAILERGSTLAGAAKIGIDAGTAVAKKLLPAQPVEYSQLLTSFLKILRSLSDEMIENNQFLCILCDEAQWSSGADFLLLKDLVRNLPPGIAFVFAFLLEAERMDNYNELRREFVRFGYHEIRLSGMDADEIKDLAKLRYDWTIDDSTAKFLRENIGDPFCLVSCFNLLQKRNLKPILANFKKILPEAVNPAQCIYSELEQHWKRRLDSLCILHPPLALSIISCMLNIKEEDMAELQDEFDHSVVFRRLEKESYDFAHASLREYRRKELPEPLRIRLHSQAAKCFETLRDRLSYKWFVEISLAEHLFLSQQYEKALELNLRLGERLYNLFDFNFALKLTERAIICAEKTNNKYKLASALHQKGLILESMFKFPDSLDAYNESLEISREINHRAGEATTLHQIGMVYQLKNRFDEALKHYNQSLVIEREIRDRAGEAQTLHQIGMVCQNTKRFDEALEYYNQSLKIVQELGDRTGEATTLHQIGMVYMDYEDKKRFNKALNYYNNSMKISREIGHRAGEAKNLHQLGMFYQKKNRYDEALDYYNQSLVIEQKIGDRAGEAKTMHQIGVVYHLANHFDLALKSFSQSLAVCREIGDKPGEEISLRTIKALKEKMRKKK